jgi:hypothetical protein
LYHFWPFQERGQKPEELKREPMFREPPRSQGKKQPMAFYYQALVFLNFFKLLRSMKNEPVIVDGFSRGSGSGGWSFFMRAT